MIIGKKLNTKKLDVKDISSYLLFYIRHHPNEINVSSLFFSFSNILHYQHDTKARKKCFESDYMLFFTHNI